MGGIQVGFHGHDDIALAFTNTLRAIEAGATVVDGTLVVMGRGTGNPKTELMLVRQAAPDGSNLDYDALSEVVSTFGAADGPRTQTMEPIYIVNSASFMIDVKLMAVMNGRVRAKPLLYKMDEIVSFGVDWDEQFQLAEMLYQVGALGTAPA